MPAISSTSSKTVAAERKIKRAKKKRVITRPAPKTQPGPISDAENRKTERHKAKPTYGKALQKARVHGPKTGRGKRLGEDKSVTPSQQKAIDRGVKQARIRYLRRVRKPPTTIKRELEGRGLIAKGLNALADARSKENAKLVPGSKGSPKMASAAPGSVKVARNLAKDVITFPSQAITSTYVPAAAAVEAARGDTSRGKKLIEDVKQTDPVYNTVAAGVEKVKGNEKAARSHIRKAGKSATEHPGLTALEVAGVKGGIGRTASRTLRGGGRTVRKVGKVTRSKTLEKAGEKIRKTGSTEREPRRVPGTNIVERREYSRDSFTKARQVNKDKLARRKARRLHEQADRARAKGHDDDANDLRAQAHEADPDRVSAKEIKRQVDEDVQLAEDIRRAHRGKTVTATRKIVKSAGRGKRALNPVAQRIVKADRQDIRRYIDELKVEAEGLSREKLRANKTLRTQLQKVVDDPKADMAKLEAAASAYHEFTASTQRKLAKLKVFDEDQLRKRAVIPYAVRRMGARHDDELRLSPTGVLKFVAKEEREATKKRVNKAQKGVERARKDLQQATASARVSAASSKTSASLKTARAELRGAQRDLAGTRRREQTQARNVAVRRSKAERARLGAERSFLRSDKEYRTIEEQLARVNREKQQLRVAVTAAKGRGERGPVASLAAASGHSRQLAADLNARADYLRSEPLARTVVRGPSKGAKTLAPRARVLRAQRREIAPKATQTKPAEAVARAKERVAAAERRVVTERQRIKGVAPAQHDRLLRAIEARDRAREALASARAEAERARESHIEAKEAGKGRRDTIKPGLVDEHGRPLPAEVIEAEMKRAGEKPAAFLTQAPNRRGAVNFNVRGERAPHHGPKGTTGAATKMGTFDVHPDTLIEGAAHGQGLVDATKHFRALIKRFGVRGDDGKVRRFESKREADAAAVDYLHHENGDPNPGAVPMRPVRLNAIGNTKATLEGLLDDVNKLTADQRNAIVESMTDAFMGKDGKGQWALIPEPAAQRIIDHLDTQGGGGGLKTVQLLNTQFRKTVLSTSPSWLAGNLIEGTGRAALAHAGPRSWWTSKRVMKRLETLDPKMAEELLSRALGGGHFTSVDRAGVRRGAEQFAGTDLAKIATGLGKFWRAPGPKQAAALWHAYTEIVMRQLNGRFEKNVQMAMLGKALRQSPLMDQRMLKLQGKAYDEAARGLMNTDTQRAFGRQVDVMYGKYGKLSPAMKKAVSTYTPFISWWINSVYFVYRTLPRDHPIVTGLIAASEMATEDWRIQYGLDQFVQNAVPTWLQGSVPLPGGGMQRASRYTPFGAFSDPTGTIAGQLTPAASSVVSALQGRDWTGKELTVTDGNGKKRAPNPLELALFAGHAFLSGTVPGLSMYERVQKGGVGAINPLKATKPPKPKGGGRIRRSSGFFGGSSSSKSSGSFFSSGGGSGSSGGGGSFFGD